MIMAWRAREGWLNFVFCDDGRVVDKKEIYGGWREQYGEYERIWEILGTTCLIRLGTPLSGVITRPIGTLTCCIGDGHLTRTGNPLNSQFRMMISLVPSHLCFSCPQFYHHLRTRSYVIRIYLSMQWSSVNTQYSTHRALHALSTAFIEHCIHRALHHPNIDRLPLPASLSSRGGPDCIQFYKVPQWPVHWWIESQLPSHLTSDLPRPDRPPPSTALISLDHGLQVHLQTRSITASKCISELHDRGLQMDLQTRSI